MLRSTQQESQICLDKNYYHEDDNNNTIDSADRADNANEANSYTNDELKTKQKGYWKKMVFHKFFKKFF